MSEDQPEYEAPNAEQAEQGEEQQTEAQEEQGGVAPTEPDPDYQPTFDYGESGDAATKAPTQAEYDEKMTFDIGHKAPKA